jgi:uncharacterized protein (DUF885 family)
MQAFKRTFIATLVFLSSFSSSFAQEEKILPSSFEWRLQQLSHTTESQRLHQLFNLYWDWRLAENPDEATLSGYCGQHDQWPNFSLEAIEKRQQFTSALLTTLTSISPLYLTEEDAISYQVLKRTLEEGLADSQFSSHYLAIDQMWGIHSYASYIIEKMPTQTVGDYANILSRLRQLPELFQQTRLLLEEGVKTGVTAPRFVIRHVPEQILNLITDEPLKNPFLQAFTHFPPSFTPTTQDHLVEEAKTIYQQHVLPALQQFYTYVTEDYMPQCRTTIAWSDLPNGEAWYAHKVRAHTTTDLTPQEIHTLGIKEVERIHQEMLAIMESTEFQGNFEEFLHFLKTDPQFFYSSREELLQGYQLLTRHIEGKLPDLFFQLPTLPFEIKSIPSYCEESQIAAYYSPGSATQQRPGCFFVNTSKLDERAKWEMIPLALHEAVPGHHLQISLAQELEGLPEFRKHAAFTAYIEGWGLYAESLGKELGLYQDPYAHFGRLTYEMLRAIRLVVDTGIHTIGWSREQAIDYFKQHVGMSDHEIETEVDRYIVTPGQALAYKVGELKLQEVRQKARVKLGQHFDLRAFHHAWLKHGTLPLDLAEQQIQEWVRTTLRTAKEEEEEEEREGANLIPLFILTYYADIDSFWKIPLFLWAL